MKTEVKITVMISHGSDSQYEEAMEEIDELISNVVGVESVNVGIGEEQN